VDGLAYEPTFRETLPMLRRTFSRFPAPERERMLGLAKQGQVVERVAEVVDYEEDRAGRVMPVVKQLLFEA
jgi:Mg/Co/Ni transporter MgtE